MEKDIKIEDELIQKAIMECREKRTEEISSSCYASLILDQLANIDVDEKRENARSSIIKVLLASTWTHRAYFIVRSVLMSWISALLTLMAIWYLGRIDVLQGFVIGIFVFVASLAISRLFDPTIFRITSNIVRRLSKHKRLRDFVLKNF